MSQQNLFTEPETEIATEELDRRAIEALKGCRMLPGSWSERFLRNMAGRFLEEKRELIPLQRYWLYYLVCKYRRQIFDKEIVDWCRRKKDEQI